MFAVEGADRGLGNGKGLQIALLFMIILDAPEVSWFLF